MRKWLSLGSLSQFPSMNPQQDQDQDLQKKIQQQQSGFYSSMVIAFILILIYKAIDNEWNTNIIPFSFFEFWHIKFTIKEGLQAALPIFGWGIFLKTISIIFRPVWLSREIIKQVDPDVFIGKGIFDSLRAGIFEEIGFRWLFFFNSIAITKLMNFILLGFMDHGIVKWVFLTIIAPISNWMSFDLLQGYIYNPLGWFVGAAMLTVNAAFREGHKYQGPIGWLNSWYVGLFFFWLMFNYGIPTAILAHIIYDVVLFCEEYVYLSYCKRKTFGEESDS
ncbi:MAG: CPBP family glutamic-type intramembrane protease [Candidatus Parcubacteria bacterium]|nr:CPBP family glutamic-type intramembrane protease [Candidatus Parcubacteria bacterium]